VTPPSRCGRAEDVAAWLGANAVRPHQSEGEQIFADLLLREVAPMLRCGGIVGGLGKIRNQQIQVLTGVAAGLDPQWVQQALEC
jgi:hypothetical protein